METNLKFISSVRYSKDYARRVSGAIVSNCTNYSYSGKIGSGLPYICELQLVIGAENSRWLNAYKSTKNTGTSPVFLDGG